MEHDRRMNVAEEHTHISINQPEQEPHYHPPILSWETFQSSSSSSNAKKAPLFTRSSRQKAAKLLSCVLRQGHSSSTSLLGVIVYPWAGTESRPFINSFPRSHFDRLSLPKSVLWATKKECQTRNGTAVSFFFVYIYNAPVALKEVNSSGWSVSGTGLICSMETPKFI